ncbi:hypothetical protein H9P43_009017 [Blastocladiella emersonii ATCC 22665]|nr:hypothetical protein H9P43_009017 [Blastocladiella emersonii ATCC 22665]
MPTYELDDLPAAVLAMNVRRSKKTLRVGPTGCFSCGICLMGGHGDCRDPFCSGMLLPPPGQKTIEFWPGTLETMPAGARAFLKLKPNGTTLFKHLDTVFGIISPSKVAVNMCSTCDKEYSAACSSSVPLGASTAPALHHPVDDNDGESTLSELESDAGAGADRGEEASDGDDDHDHDEYEQLDKPARASSSRQLATRRIPGPTSSRKPPALRSPAPTASASTTSASPSSSLKTLEANLKINGRCKNNCPMNAQMLIKMAGAANVWDTFNTTLDDTLCACSYSCVAKAPLRYTFPTSSRKSKKPEAYDPANTFALVNKDMLKLMVQAAVNTNKVPTIIVDTDCLNKLSLVRRRLAQRRMGGMVMFALALGPRVTSRTLDRREDSPLHSLDDPDNGLAEQLNEDFMAQARASM